MKGILSQWTKCDCWSGTSGDDLTKSDLGIIQEMYLQGLSSDQLTYTRDLSWKGDSLGMGDIRASIERRYPGIFALIWNGSGASPTLDITFPIRQMLIRCLNYVDEKRSFTVTSRVVNQPLRWYTDLRGIFSVMTSQSDDMSLVSFQFNEIFVGIFSGDGNTLFSCTYHAPGMSLIAGIYSYMFGNNSLLMEDVNQQWFSPKICGIK